MSNSIMRDKAKEFAKKEGERARKYIAQGIIKILPVCETSHKEVSQFYSPAARSIASQ